MMSLDFIPDIVEARKFFRLAADRGCEESRIMIPLVDRLMSPEQISESERRVRKWNADHPTLN